MGNVFKRSLKVVVGFVLLALMALVVLSCGSGGGGGGSSSSGSTYFSTTTTTTSTASGTTPGWHNQGLNCLYCHSTVFAGSTKQLLIGGTVFKTVTVSDTDNVSNACNANVHVQLVDPSFTVVYDSLNYVDTVSNADNGTGNIFILSRKLSSLTGEYYMRLVTGDNITIGQSRNLHTFTSNYDNSTPADLLNRYSCNVCHNATPQFNADGRLYPNIDASKCN
ncbi:MAG: hypothetical protein HQK88_11395 [Nitrospirae bacterium]|nr:hypothetical protein [Nitrospirota bacterium]MBF0535567.1 hypothetical protein [Nitrospirota bacterium]MBF0617406.1 hypothetical protein [Nitrospirota bacterium]